MEKNMNASAMGKMVAAFVAIIIAIVLLGQVVTVGNGVTELTRGTETMSFNAAKDAAGNTNPATEFYPLFINDSVNGWRSNIGGCDVGTVASSITVANSTGGSWNTGNYSVSTTNGSIRFLDTVVVNTTLNNISVISYATCPSGYVYGWAATMLRLTYGFFALAAMGVAIALFYSIAKDYGII